MLPYAGMNDHVLFDWESYNPQDRAVLCFLRNDTELLLIHKKRGLGAGKINGPGGKQDPGETLQEAAIRETREETGLEPTAPRHQGVLRFAFADGYQLEVHIFLADRWSGEMRETDEATPFWTRQEEIPYDRMWEDDRYWLPRVLLGHTVEAEMLFEDDRMIFWDLRFSDGIRFRGTAGESANSPALHQPSARG